MKAILFAGVSALGALTALPALAQPADSSSDITIFGYNVNASLRAQVAPTYEGSNDYRVGPAGGISLSKHGSEHVFSAADDSASLTLLGDKKVAFGIAGRLRSGRDNKDDLRGMDKIDWAVEAGLFGNVWLTDWLRARAEVRRGFGGNEGVIVDVGADAVTKTGRWTVAAGPRFSWADQEFTRTYFGVTAKEAIASPYIAAAYNPDGGPRYAGVVASADYQWSDHWRITADAGYRRLMGDAADSPLVKGLGSENQFNASLGVRYGLGG